MPLATLERRLSCLAEIARIINSSDDLDDILGPVLRHLSDTVYLQRPTMTLLDRQSGSLRMEAAHGLTPKEIRRISFAPGEGITGDVLRRQEPAIVRRISQDERFVDKSGITLEGDKSAVCVPIVEREEAIGTLAGYRSISTERELQPDVHLLQSVACMLAPAVRAKVDAWARADIEAPPQFQPATLIGRSRAMRAVYEAIDQVADTRTPVLLRGEAGTGKARVAKALCAHSGRARAPFLTVNCATHPDAALDRLLFGQTGERVSSSISPEGMVARADGGTLFVEEVGSLPPRIQAKLLTFLVDGTYRRIDDVHTYQADVRILAASRRDLEQQVSNGDFLPELYYKLTVFPIHLPPLRERRSDILLLADHFLEHLSRTHGKAVRRIATSAIDLMMAYHWPGNVRELENCIERAVLLARNEVILGHHLPPTLQIQEEAPHGRGLREQLERVERDLISDALKATRGNMARAARDLQITERIMGLRVKHYRIDPKRFKERD